MSILTASMYGFYVISCSRDTRVYCTTVFFFFNFIILYSVVLGHDICTTVGSVPGLLARTVRVTICVIPSDLQWHCRLFTRHGSRGWRSFLTAIDGGEGIIRNVCAYLLIPVLDVRSDTTHHVHRTPTSSPSQRAPSPRSSFHSSPLRTSSTGPTCA